ncbi:MAG: ABC transporter permease [Candidatus Eremiobacteraeota bacterium]|nr:ABC transporter permease [Candidatus Eremiobacteraeota bacterium]
MNTFHIMRKELRTYFNSTIAYAFFLIFLFIVGYLFTFTIFQYSDFSQLAIRNPMMMQKLNPAQSILTPLFQLMGFLLIFLVPVLTMRIFAEEKKLGTIELLFTYPVTEMQLVIGKFLASTAILFIMFLFSFVYIILFNNVFAFKGAEVPWGIIFSGYLGIFLLSLSFMAFGMWVSSLTSDQVTSALATVGGLLLFWIIGSAQSQFTNPVLVGIVRQLSLVNHFQDFTKGIINTHHLVYFICFILFFVFLTVQVLEVRKWKG